MSADSKIEWTDDTWTPIRARHKTSGKVGVHCEHVSEACRHCYAESMNRRLGTGLDYKPGNLEKVELFLDEKMLLAPLHRRKPRKIFVCSTTDLFGEWVSDEWIDRMFAVMALCPQHTFQVLTKRPTRMREYFAGNADQTRRSIVNNTCFGVSQWLGGRFTDEQCHIRRWPLPNVWLGVTAEDQATADSRIPDLLATPAALRFVSIEPMLGRVDLTWIAQPDDDRDGVIDALAGRDWINGEGFGTLQRVWRYPDANQIWKRYVGPPRAKLDWVICGGESGAHARPMHPAWARSLRDQCAAAGIPYFFKQWGTWAPVKLPTLEGDTTIWPDGCVGRGNANDCGGTGHSMRRVGKARAGHLLDGIEHREFPGGQNGYQE